jgi:beta-aspartyl-peptidase (threonine type)
MGRMQQYVVAIHGGAGTLLELGAYRESMQGILRRVRERAAAGAPALDLVEYAVTLLEDDVLYNAGRGSVLNARGEVECEASIADGRTLDVGGVVNVSGVKNPVCLARTVLEHSPHVMLVGAGAGAFAKQHEVSLESPEYFITESRREQLEKAQQEGKIVLDHSDSDKVRPVEDKKLGTVGAVAIDAQGNLAAATSTGGIVNKQFGRMGDSAVMGAGVYAENGLCAVSATGYGEQFLRTSLAKHIAEHRRYTQADGQAAAEAGILFLKMKANGLGGVIVLDNEYRVGVAHNTPIILGGSVSFTDEQPTLFF